MLQCDIESAFQRVLQSGWFILGPEVDAFEEEFAAFHGTAHAVGVASGTDAIELALRAGDVGGGDEVITVSHTAIATIVAIERTGATPVLVDIDSETYTMDPNAALAAITPQTKAIIPVHLYGQPANLSDLTEIASSRQLLMIEDCAQAHGATYGNKLVGTFGHMGAFSFYPTKNLGALGDGGAIITNDSQLADRLRRLRNYGQSSRYESIERGVNSRLDEIQAAILRAKLQHLDDFVSNRRVLARQYDRYLSDVTLPGGSDADGHSYHLYVIRHPDRDKIMRELESHEIGTLIHYPIPVHLQSAYRHMQIPRGSLPKTEQVVKEILSLPLYQGLSELETVTISEVVRSALGTNVA